MDLVFSKAGADLCFKSKGSSSEFSLTLSWLAFTENTVKGPLLGANVTLSHLYNLLSGAEYHASGARTESVPLGLLC